MQAMWVSQREMAMATQTTIISSHINILYRFNGNPMKFKFQGPSLRRNGIICSYKMFL